MKVLDVKFTEAILTIFLTDGSVVSAPLAWYPKLMFATPSDLRNFVTGKKELRWPRLRFRLNIQDVFDGIPDPGILSTWMREFAPVIGK